MEADPGRRGLSSWTRCSSCTSLGLTDGPGLLATPFAVVTGLTYNFLPFMVLPLYARSRRSTRGCIEAGADLYASPFTTFRKVTLPLSMPGLVGRDAADLHPGRR